MSKVIACILIMILASAAFGENIPKDPDLMDYVMESPSRIVIDGELTDGSPTWHRWRPSSYSELSLDCNLIMSSDYSTEPHFDMYCFNVADSAPVEFVVDDAGFDTVIYIYCDPFDPGLATDNAVYMDDDDGVGLNSAITADNGVTLTPGNDYWFVICSYSTSIGTFSVSTSDNVSLCGSVDTESKGLGSIKSLYR